MDDDIILITELNDFIFCPISIYFHKVYGNRDEYTFQSNSQLNGKAAHSAIDNGAYSSEKDVFMGMEVYSEKYGLMGKVDIFDNKHHILRERKKYIKQIYDGYVFQIYAQYFSLIEMGYKVERLELYSLDDHKTYNIKLPNDDGEMFTKFENTINSIRNFNTNSFIQNNIEKCSHCIYEPACDCSLLEN